MQQIVFQGERKNQLDAGIMRIQGAQEILNPKCILFHLYFGFAKQDQAAEIIGRLKEEFPESKIAGCAANSEIAAGRVMPQCVLVSAMLFREAEVEVVCYDDISADPAGIGRDLLEKVNAVPDARGVEILMKGSDFDPSKIFEHLELCSREIRIFGGIAAGHRLFVDPDFVVDENGVHEDALTAVIYSGRALRIDMDRTAGWNRLGQSFPITKAEGKRLIEVADRPAIELYDRYLQISRNDSFISDSTEFPLLVMQDGEEMLRHPISLQEDGTLILAGDVKVGSRLYLSYGNPTVIIDEVNRRCEEVRQFEPQAILIYSCVVRRLFWEDFASKELEPFSKLASTAGFYTGGEIMRDMRTGKIFVHNITMLSIAMREGEKPGRKAERVAVDDSMLKGQASLVQRLARLIKSTMDELVIMNERLEHMATVDELTGLYNRREIERRIIEAMHHSFGMKASLGLVMLDIDHFKHVNDNYGHDIGDAVLRSVSAILRKKVNKRRGEAAGRWGGEEFFIILPERDLDEAVEFAEDVRKTIEAYEFKAVGSLTSSFGVIEPKSWMSRDQMFKYVDDALYEAKEAGRNRVIAVDSDFIMKEKQGEIAKNK